MYQKILDSFHSLMVFYHTLIMWPLASEWTFVCHTTMCRNTINFLCSPGNMTLWCVEVVPVVYARVDLYLYFKVTCIHLECLFSNDSHSIIYTISLKIHVNNVLLYLRGRMIHCDLDLHLRVTSDNYGILLLNDDLNYQWYVLQTTAS